MSVPRTTPVETSLVDIVERFQPAGIDLRQAGKFENRLHTFLASGDPVAVEARGDNMRDVNCREQIQAHRI